MQQLQLEIVDQLLHENSLSDLSTQNLKLPNRDE